MSVRIEVAVGHERAILFAPDCVERENLLRELEGRRRFLRRGGLQIEWTGHNRARVEHYWPETKVTEPLPLEIPFVGYSGTYRPKTTPMRHQEEALGAMRAAPKPVFALFMEPGTGKTKVALDRAGELYRDGVITRMLVIAPKGVHRQWVVQQIPKHLGVPFDARAWPRDFSRVPPRPRKLAIFTINDDAAKTKRGEKAIRAFLKPGEPFMLAGDESHRFKNYKSARTLAIRDYAASKDARYKLLMSGTPIAKNLEDEWSQFYILDPDILGIKYVTTFRREYCIMGGFEFRQVVGYRNLETFKALTAPYVYRVKRTDLGMVPDEYNDWLFSLTDMQKHLIREIRRQIIIEIREGSIVSPQEAAHKTLKIQQVSNGWVYDDDGVFQEIIPPEKNPRLIALQEWAGDTDLEESPIAIWCRFLPDIAAVKRIFPDAYEYHGGVRDKDREANVEAWLGGGGVFVGTPGAGGVGLNLQGRCARVAYWSQSENYVDRVQSEARFSRIGKPGPIEFTDFVAPGSRDRAIQRNYRNKDGLARLVLDDIVRDLEGMEEEE